MRAVTWSVREVATSVGPARLHRLGRAVAGRPTLVLGHGAGGGVEAPDLRALAVAASEAGCACVLVEQPWRVGGGRIAPRPAILDEAWVQSLRRLRPRGPLVVGGRSAGARVACRTAVEVGAAAVLALAFPLHPPGRPDRTRAGELADCPLPRLVLQGTRDAFGTAAELAFAVPSARVVEVPGADHSLRADRLGPVLHEALAFLDTVRGSSS